MPVPEQQKAIRRIQKLAAEGLSSYKISAVLDFRTSFKLIAECTLRPQCPSLQPFSDSWE